MAADGSDYFEPLVILQFSSSAPTATKQWVLERLTASHNDDEGAGFLARYEIDAERNVRLPRVALNAV